VGLQALVTLLQNTVLFYKVIKITYISVASKKKHYWYLDASFENWKRLFKWQEERYRT
jgi:uncharacterized protein YccT (UPF0319 family)